jgi:phytoene dehydrogenase-like protein
MITSSNDKVTGVVLEDGTEIQAKVVLSNATPKITFLDLLPQVSKCCFMLLHFTSLLYFALL